MEVVRCGKWGKGMSRSFRPAVYVASMACLWAMVAAQAAQAPPTAPPPCTGCSRDLVSTVWGFILTLVALTLDDWGTVKNNDENFIGKVVWVIVVGSLNPLFSLFIRLSKLIQSLEMRKRMSTPLARSYIKILSGCLVVVNLSPTADENVHKLDAFESEVEVEDFSDALVIGSQVETGTRVQLTAVGIAALIKAQVLPPVERLKILQGYSGLAVAVSATQAVGYMYGILVRVVQGLHVSPLEAIGFYLSVIILVKASWHYYSSSCHRPLLLFLEVDKEVKFTDMCKAPEGVQSEWSRSTNFKVWNLILFFGGIIILPGGVLMFFIITIAKSTSLSIAIPLIILEVAILPMIIVLLMIGFDCFLPETIIDSDIFTSMVASIGSIGNSVGYIYGLVLTVKYWETLVFNGDSSGYLSQLLPYIG